MNISIFIITMLLTFSSNLWAKLPANYQQIDAKSKQEILWNNSTSTLYSVLPTGNPGVIESLSLLSSKFLLPSFTHVSDEIPRGRKKLLHTYGSVAKVRWVPVGNHSYTGLFDSGAVGIARLSLARQGGNFIPGMGLKLLIDGRPSANLHVMNRLDGQGENKNFFEHTFTNDLPKPNFALELLAVAFDEAVNYLRPGSSPFHLPVGHLAKRDREGMLQRNIQFPAVLEFRPTLTVQMSPSSNADTRVKFYRLKAEVVMYTNWAKKTKES